MKFATRLCHISHHTLGMLLHYLGKFKVYVCCKHGTKCKQSTSTFAHTDFIAAQLLTYHFNKPRFLTYQGSAATDIRCGGVSCSKFHMLSGGKKFCRSVKV